MYTLTLIVLNPNHDEFFGTGACRTLGPKFNDRLSTPLFSNARASIHRLWPLASPASVITVGDRTWLSGGARDMYRNGPAPETLGALRWHRSEKAEILGAHDEFPLAT